MPGSKVGDGLGEPRTTLAGEMQAIITVRQFPPKESRRKCVSLDWRKGTWSRPRSDRALTHCSRKESDLLMYIASRRMAPVLCVLVTRSDPARSTMWIFDESTRSADSTRERDSTYTVKMQCDLDDAEFSCSTQDVHNHARARTHTLIYVISRPETDNDVLSTSSIPNEMRIQQGRFQGRVKTPRGTTTQSLGRW